MIVELWLFVLMLMADLILVNSDDSFVSNILQIEPCRDGEHSLVNSIYVYDLPTELALTDCDSTREFYAEKIIFEHLFRSKCRQKDARAATLYFVPVFFGCVHHHFRKTMSPDSVDIQINKLFQRLMTFVRNVVDC